MAEFIYTMKKVRKAHGDKVILDDVYIQFYPGAKIGVVGPNGAGKSSVLKIMAENFLEEGFERGVHPVMLDLLRWHAAEEIEHRAVAFEVLRRVDDRFAVRMAGLALAGSVLAAFWIAGALTLLAQENNLLSAVRREGREVSERLPFGERVFGRGIRSYFRRDFHPNDAAHLDAMAAVVLSSFGRPSSPEPQPAV